MVEAMQSDHEETARCDAPLASSSMHAMHRPRATAVRRMVRVTAALLAVLPMLTFACGIILNGLGREVVGIVFDIGLAALAVDALALVCALLALALIAPR